MSHEDLTLRDRIVDWLHTLKDRGGSFDQLIARICRDLENEAYEVSDRDPTPEEEAREHDEWLASLDEDQPAEALPKVDSATLGAGKPAEWDRCYYCGVRKEECEPTTPCRGMYEFSHLFADPFASKPLLWGKHCRGLGCDDFNEATPSCSCECSACKRNFRETEATVESVAGHGIQVPISKALEMWKQRALSAEEELAKLTDEGSDGTDRVLRTYPGIDPNLARQLAESLDAPTKAEATTNVDRLRELQNAWAVRIEGAKAPFDVGRISHASEDGMVHICALSGSKMGWVHISKLSPVEEPKRPKPPMKGWCPYCGNMGHNYVCEEMQAWKDGPDKPLPEGPEIEAAFPDRTGRWDLYTEACRYVGARQSKIGLVALVNWLLQRAEPKPATCRLCGQSTVCLGGAQHDWGEPTKPAEVLEALVKWGMECKADFDRRTSRVVHGEREQRKPEDNPEPCPDCGERDCGGAPRFKGTTLEERMAMRQRETEIRISCPTCKSDIKASEHRGLVINKAASIRAELVSLKTSKALWAPAKIEELEADLRVWEALLSR